MTRKTKTLKSNKKEYLVSDIVFFILGISLFCLFFLSAKNGIGIPDEPYYFTIPQRLQQGDRLFGEEWAIEQMAMLFDWIPYKLYILICGSTEGILLFARYLFLCIDAIFYVFSYIKLRKYKLWGVTAAFLFCSLLPPSRFAIQYHAVSLMATMLICLLLFTDNKEKSWGTLVFCGVLLACAVLAEPFLLILYIAFISAFIVYSIKKRKKDKPVCDSYMLNRKTIIAISAGSFGMLFLFIAALIAMNSFSILPKTVTWLLSDPEYNISNLFDVEKIKSAVQLFGRISIVGEVLCLIAAIIFTVHKKKNKKARLIIGMLSCVFLTSCYLFAFYHANESWVSTLNEILFHEFPVLLFSSVVFFLCEKKDRGMIYIWCTGLGFSIAVDVSSDVILGLGGKISMLSGIMALRTLAAEMKADFDSDFDAPRAFRSGKKSLRKACCCFGVLCGVCFLSWNISYIFDEGLSPLVETVFSGRNAATLTAEIQSGPCKGLKTTPTIESVYSATIADLDKIKSDYNRGNVLILGTCPMAYLYLDYPYATPSGFFASEMERLEAYFTIFPNKRPDIIYINFYDYFYYSPYPEEVINNELLFVKEQFETCVDSVVEGNVGYIISIRNE